MSPERPADHGFAPGRRRKAVQSLTAAEEIMDLADDGADIGDAYVTLCVHAGIAAADTLCAHHLGRYNSGENHNEATAPSPPRNAYKPDAVPGPSWTPPEPYRCD